MADNTAVTPAAPQQGAKQDNIQREQQGGEKAGKGMQQPKERTEGREIKPAKEQGQKRKKPVDGQIRDNRDPQFRREKRQRFNDDERDKAPSVKKVETIDDIRSDNARITKEIYQVIASMKDITIE